MQLDLKKNLGNTDRIIRSIVGLILLWLVFSQSLTGLGVTIALIFAAFQFVEAVLGYRIVYDLMGWSTR